MECFLSVRHEAYAPIISPYITSAIFSEEFYQRKKAGSVAIDVGLSAVVRVDASSYVTSMARLCFAAKKRALFFLS